MFLKDQCGTIIPRSWWISKFSFHNPIPANCFRVSSEIIIFLPNFVNSGLFERKHFEVYANLNKIWKSGQYLSFFQHFQICLDFALSGGLSFSATTDR